MMTVMIVNISDSGSGLSPQHTLYKTSLLYSRLYSLLYSPPPLQ